jgi:4-phosphopantoate--beta-alanine ligase
VSIPKDHPRYQSLMVRERLAEAVDQGLVHPTGLISQGRGEAFDYLMGEKTLTAALDAERAAAAMLLRAKKPLVCVNGNSAALDAKGLIALAAAVPAALEVNIFHRTAERMELLVNYMESQGAKGVLGREPDARIPGLTSDRALCSETLYECDVIVVPIEDGDRAEALIKMGKKVISIDLNPLSRTSKVATVPISDEISRALANIIRFVGELKGEEKNIDAVISDFSADETRKKTIAEICRYLESQ